MHRTRTQAGKFQFFYWPVTRGTEAKPWRVSLERWGLVQDEHHVSKRQDAVTQWNCVPHSGVWGMRFLTWKWTRRSGLKASKILHKALRVKKSRRVWNLNNCREFWKDGQWSSGTSGLSSLRMSETAPCSWQQGTSQNRALSYQPQRHKGRVTDWFFTPKLCPWQCQGLDWGRSIATPSYSDFPFVLPYDHLCLFYFKIYSLKKLYILS